MSTGAKRAGDANTPVSQDTPAAETSTPINVRPSSPLTPTRHSRLQEKAELQNLNDRLACYIDRVRNLENANSRLTREVQTTREAISHEASSIKQIYEHELSDARKLLDETAKEKAKLEIDTKRLWEENDELKARLDKKTKELSTAENSARVYESKCTEVSGKYNTARADQKKAQHEAKELEKDNERLRKQLDELRKHLEDETLARVDLENMLQSLREELTFKDEIHTQELSETRTRREVEVSEIDGRLSEQYEAKLQQSLQELRDQYEGQMRTNREEIEMLYENKLKNLWSAANRNSNAAAKAFEELKTTRSKIELVNSQIGELEAINSSLNARIRDLDKQLEVERARHSDDIAVLEAELSRLRDEMSQQLQEYQDLMDIKVSLDLEIAAYDKMLRGEEHRLNIPPSSNTSVSQLSQSLRSVRVTTPSRAGIKRKRTDVDETVDSVDRSHAEYFVIASAEGDVEISDADPEGKFVKLHNKSNKKVNVGGWQIIRTAGNNETSLKLHRSAKIDNGAFITIWSSDSGVAHKPPTNVVMKQQKWLIGENMKTVLLNSEGKDVAVSERVKQQIPTQASRRRRGGYGAEEKVDRQQVRETTNTSVRGEETCRIM